MVSGIIPLSSIRDVFQPRKQSELVFKSFPYCDGWYFTLETHSLVSYFKTSLLHNSEVYLRRTMLWSLYFYIFEEVSGRSQCSLQKWVQKLGFACLWNKWSQNSLLWASLRWAFCVHIWKGGWNFKEDCSAKEMRCCVIGAEGSTSAPSRAGSLCENCGWRGEGDTFQREAWGWVSSSVGQGPWTGSEIGLDQ